MPLMRRGIAQEGFQSLESILAINAGTCYLQNQGFPGIHVAARQIGVGKQTIELQKYQTGGQRRAFVAIDKRMIAAQIKQVSSGDFQRVKD